MSFTPNWGFVMEMKNIIQQQISNNSIIHMKQKTSNEYLFFICKIRSIKILSILSLMKELRHVCVWWHVLLASSYNKDSCKCMTIYIRDNDTNINKQWSILLRRQITIPNSQSEIDFKNHIVPVSYNSQQWVVHVQSPQHVAETSNSPWSWLGLGKRSFQEMTETQDECHEFQSLEWNQEELQSIQSEEIKIEHISITKQSAQIISTIDTYFRNIKGNHTDKRIELSHCQISNLRFKTKVIHLSIIDIQSIIHVLDIFPRYIVDIEIQWHTKSECCILIEWTTQTDKLWIPSFDEDCKKTEWNNLILFDCEKLSTDSVI